MRKYPFAVILWLALTVGVQAASLAEKGREGAIQGCSACHQVTANQKPPPPVFNPDEASNVPAPSFVVIARRYGSEPGLLKSLITNPRHPMREQEFNKSDLRAVVAYIQSLRPDAPKARP